MFQLYYSIGWKTSTKQNKTFLHLGKSMSIWLERFQKDNFEFSSHLVNALSWLEREVFSFVIVPKLFQKYSPDYGDTFGYSIVPMLTRRRQKKDKIKI